MDLARLALQQAQDLDPQSRVWQLRSALLCPEVFPSEQALTEFREQLEVAVEECLPANRPLSRTELFAIGFVPPYGLSYHGIANRRVKENFAAGCRASLGGSGRRPGKRSGVIRVGFVVTPGHEGGFLRSHAGILNLLDRRRFSPGLICDEKAAAKMMRVIRSSDLFHVPIGSQFRQNVAAIEKAECDVLYHWEVGSDAMNYFLPMAKCAPVQCTSWGTQSTTGQHEVDYYLSCEHAETAEDQADYAEQLWLMKSLPTYQQRLQAPPPADRSAFGLSGSDHLYLCPQSLLKIHPDQDEAFASLLRADQRGKLVLLHGAYESTGNQLRQRFQRTIPDVADRITFLPRQSREAFLQLLPLADAILDPLHYSAGSSAYDILSLNLPIVAFAGKQFVSRYTLACYRQMQMTGLVANTVAEYVSIAVRVANDRNHRQQLSNELADRSHRLFQDELAVTEHERFFEHATD
jgi:predicted O-linked N-acetylglucosamine transferase (SPINDLY family)